MSESQFTELTREIRRMDLYTQFAMKEILALEAEVKELKETIKQLYVQINDISTKAWR